ncbi:hypothetical protein EVAR_80966_1 [Eumeta japonica]|uniref:Uncharacterized protein n=1 Tax=Eumeta variegata TaxID=151549 RepID=A0A4C1WSA0_EUMVA|nr:hypothetical protein EVAR_80966_1 [Eumeta japonica]
MKRNGIHIGNRIGTESEARTEVESRDNGVEAISIADPSYAAGVVRAGPPDPAAAASAAAAAEEAMYRAPPEHRPYVRIVEQPAAKALRYAQCEACAAQACTPYTSRGVCGCDQRTLKLSVCCL